MTNTKEWGIPLNPLSLLWLALLTAISLTQVACNGSGSDGGTVPVARASVSISGTVSGTRIVAMNSSNQIIAEDDTAGRTATVPGQFPFMLSGVPVNVPVRLFFVTGGTIYPLYIGSTSTNVFSFRTGDAVNLGFVTVANDRASAQSPPTNVSLGSPNSTIPVTLIPLPPGTEPALSVVNPVDRAQFAPGPVPVWFVAHRFSIGTLSQGQTHLHFYIDRGLLRHEFQNGSGIDEENGVLLNDTHTHFVHWNSDNSIDLLGLAPGPHEVRFVLADANHDELAPANPEATKTLNFTVLAPPPNEFELVPMVGRLNLPVSMAFAPDGRLFVNEQKSGNVRIVNTTGNTWQLQPTPWCTVPVYTGGFEQGLLGIALDPAFSTNGFVYVYRTAAAASGSLPARNQVVRYRDAAGVCQGGSETVILDGIPSSDDHNGGIMQFGPDGSLYVTTGDAQNSGSAQDLTSLAGKVLRINPADGTGLPNNPFFTDPNANTKRVLSFGHRNIFGLTFDPVTLVPVITENGWNDNDEINRIVPGGDYGWNSQQQMGILNDPANYSDVTKTIDPIAVFFPAPGPTIAPTGIIPITGSVYPASMQNSLLFVDFVGGNFRRLVLGGAARTDLAAPPITSPGGVGPLTDLKKGLDGFIYSSGLGNYMQPDQGTIYRVEPTP